ncbi:MAG TPA: phosphotransferase [Candidatus Tumulicola sp.]
MPQWTADIDIDAALAARLVAGQFPELACSSVQPFGFGWDNAAFLIDRRIVFRFPRRKIASTLIEREIALLPLVAKHVPLAISAPQFIGAKTTEYPWVFAGYTSIAGSTLCSMALSDTARTALAEPIAEFLKALHHVEPAGLVARGLPPDDIGRLDHEKRLRVTRERISGLAALGQIASGDHFASWLEAHPPVPLHDEKRRLVHGDLYARHILIDDSGALSIGATFISAIRHWTSRSRIWFYHRPHTRRFAPHMAQSTIERGLQHDTERYITQF